MHAGCIQFIQVDMRVFLTKMYQEAATFPHGNCLQGKRGCLPDELLEDMLRLLYSFLISSLMSRLAEHTIFSLQ